MVNDNPPAKRAKKVGAPQVTLLDYGIGNVRSVRNAISKLGYEIVDVTKPEDIMNADKLIFPGVGSFGAAMKILHEKHYIEPLREYIKADRPFFGICLGMQVLFEESEEGGVKGMGVIPGKITKFKGSLSVPHIGWNGVRSVKPSPLLSADDAANHFYFVHSYHATPSEANEDWLWTVSDYGQRFISAVQKGRVSATQFHPEKSSGAGLALLHRFLTSSAPVSAPVAVKEDNGLAARLATIPATQLVKRVIACLDVRSNDAGDLVVTKGDQYDVREEAEGESKGAVRNLGKPVELAARYYKEGADEVTFLNITSFRNCPMRDAPMLKVLQEASKEVFVPLTIGGGIRDFTDDQGKTWSALDVAGEYFRSGADKVSIGSDAVYAAEEWVKTGKKTGKTAIEQISTSYGAQAVVISVDPRRVYVESPTLTPHHCVEALNEGPNGEKFCWYQCTVKGGREGRDIDARTLAKACEALGAGELLINCIDNDGAKQGFDTALIKDLSEAVNIPVIASSGAGNPSHFSDVFTSTNAEAALAAGIFHRREVPLEAVKAHLREAGIPTRLV